MFSFSDSLGPVFLFFIERDRLACSSSPSMDGVRRTERVPLDAHGPLARF